MNSASNDIAPRHFDLIVLGSGAAGLTAALTAALSGLSCLVLEHLDRIGGTSARSSGSVWVPDNGFMRKAGKDDAKVARTYLDALVGERAPPAMRQTFLANAPAMQADLEDRADISFRPFPAAPDYRQDLPGAASGWRPLDPCPFDGRKLGTDFAHLATPLPELMLFGGMMVTRAEAASLLKADRSLRSAWLGLRLVARYLRDRLGWPRGTRLVLGNALIARLWHACRIRGVEVLRNAETMRLLMDGGRVSGVEVKHGGRSETIRALQGVVLAGGGFPASAEWRRRELPDPVAEYTPASPGAVGRTLELALAIGAKLGPSGLDNAQWFPSSLMTRDDGSTAIWPHIVLDRAKPGALIVDQSGKRFGNEAVSYHEFVRAMYRSSAVPCWMICDRRFIRKYGLGLIRPRTPSIRRYVENGYLTEGASLKDLADKIGLPAEALMETVARFNGFSRTGIDEDFARGQTIYERNNGDAAHSPNPCLGPVGEGRVYAVRLEPTPLGTSRGLMTDETARVLDKSGEPITGLYACGNDMQSAFGGEYPGAGAQLGQAMTFGWIAARHAAGTGNFREET